MDEFSENAAMDGQDSYALTKIFKKLAEDLSNSRTRSNLSIDRTNTSALVES